METRREFIRKATLLSGAAGMFTALPPAIQRALAIDPAAGTTWRDAEHVVILMQENRSFDHCYGSLRGVRGFRDPRAITLPNQNPVWLQSNAAGQTYFPFRLDIKDTQATWMGSLPHSWSNQVDARNEGHFDQWLQAKPSGREGYQDMPLTLGYYTRQDIPFYYALADAFTVCDQNFSSSLTGTTPNRLYLWTGTIREKADADSPAMVRNEDLDYDDARLAHWTTFPERLEEHNISWKVYQNELSVGVGFEGEEDAWLANFTDNPLEWFEQYHVKFSEAHRRYLPRRIEALRQEIARLGTAASAARTEKEQALQQALEDQQRFTAEAYAALTERARNLHEKAFTTNRIDPDYHTLATLPYQEGDAARQVQVPKGDTLAQFRADVAAGTLPTVSWVVAPENFSDHPGAPWYGAWYVSEVMDILTNKPEVWKKTIFILCYDENDGYFDHVPPFVPPHPDKPDSGKVSAGIDTAVEYVTLAQDRLRKPNNEARESPIGLGYRVPLVIASPWSRGGAVCSQVFDHTSVLQFLEKFLSHKTGQAVVEPNISAWRRTVCGDLTSVFKPYQGEKIPLPSFLEHDQVIASIHRARFKQVPSGYRALTADEVAALRRAPRTAAALFPQEPGTRPARAIPYELYADGMLSDDRKTFRMTLEARRNLFGQAAAGAPFHVYAQGLVNRRAPRAYAVKAGDGLQDTWDIAAFAGGHYALQVYGPNGFYRAFAGDAQDPALTIACAYTRDKKGRADGHIVITFRNTGPRALVVHVVDNAYQAAPQVKTVAAGREASCRLALDKSAGWYDASVTVEGYKTFRKQYAGHVETGQESLTDPQMA
ncbi:phosphocholine-specific phospholipase C [Dawidia soli]|uniref:phospholipase C n=1 Tax=Dawidia soli TaxID=2782352 RepID=A0AAP2DEK3_9BACT|nr:phospholipase C, phosphocholine-specific [Dawidia soli]MBT1690629.1 phospholipase C, phosphocholine-specific [Dawidia soli]